MLNIPSLPPMARTILIYAGWFTLPNWATNATIVLFNRTASHFKPKYSPPAKGSPQAIDQWRYSYAFVMISYLVTTTIHSCLSMPLNFYEILGVSPSADDQALKVAFRTFARKNHPDRVGPKGAPLFIAVRDAFESLNHPVKRFAYDRFGPDAMTWTDCATPREYLRHGLLASSGFYIGTVAFLLVWSVLGARNSGTYWRNLLFCTLFFLEFSLIVNSPSTSALESFSLFPLSTMFPRRVPYQHTLLLHQLYMSLSIAISRVVPVLFTEPREGSRAVDLTMSAVKPIVEKLAFLATTADREVSRMLSAEIRSMHGSSALPSAHNGVSPSKRGSSSAHVFPEAPFIPSDSTIAALTAEMENLIIDKQIQSHPLLRGYWDAAVARRRQESDPHEHQEEPRPGRTLTLPSPPQSLSPIEIPKEFAPDAPQRLQRTRQTLQRLPSTRELPSPRPSPPRELGLHAAMPQSVGVTTGSGTVRGRSCSY